MKQVRGELLLVTNTQHLFIVQATAIGRRVNVVDGGKRSETTSLESKETHTILVNLQEVVAVTS
jgi:hypothetical protein